MCVVCVSIPVPFPLCMMWWGGCMVQVHAHENQVSLGMPQVLATLVFETVSGFAWNLLVVVSGLVSKPQGASCLCLPVLGTCWRW